MKRWTWLFAAALATAGAVPLASTAQADTENATPISMDKVPAPARKTLEREAAGGTIIKVVQETEGNQTVYEAHVRVHDDVLGIEVDPNGKLLRRESEKNEKH